MPGMAAFGTALKRTNSDSPVTYTTIANVENIEGPGFTSEDIEVTSHDSPNRFKEWVAGLKDGAELKMDINWDPSAVTHESLLDDYDAASSKAYQLVWPTSPTITWTFSAYIKEFTPKAPVAGKLSASVTYKIAGAVTRP